MFFCLCDIGNYKSKSKNDDEIQEDDYSENWMDKVKKKVFMCNENKSFDESFTNIKSENKKNDLSGYFYDYKFGAGGLYLKVGLAGSSIV